MIKTLNGDEFYNVDWLPGMGTLIPVETIKKIGLWDNINFPQYHGDIDFTLRAKNNKINVIISPSLKIFNDTNLSSFEANNIRDIKSALTRLNSRYNIKLNIKFYRKHTSTPLWIIPFLKNIIIVIYKAVLIKRQ
jgi:GT2 family glycosyltransferase